MTHIEQLRCLIYRKYGVNICCRYIKVHYLFRKLSCIILPTDARGVLFHRALVIYIRSNNNICTLTNLETVA